MTRKEKIAAYLAEYIKSRDAAQAECNKVCDMAWAEYAKLRDQAEDDCTEVVPLPIGPCLMDPTELECWELAKSIFHTDDYASWPGAVVWAGTKFVVYVRLPESEWYGAQIKSWKWHDIEWRFTGPVSALEKSC